MLPKSKQRHLISLFPFVAFLQNWALGYNETGLLRSEIKAQRCVSRLEWTSVYSQVLLGCFLSIRSCEIALFTSKDLIWRIGCRFPVLAQRWKLKLNDSGQPGSVAGNLPLLCLSLLNCGMFPSYFPPPTPLPPHTHSPWSPPYTPLATSLFFCHLRQRSGYTTSLAGSENCCRPVCSPTLAKKALLPAVFIPHSLSVQWEVWHSHALCGGALGILSMICPESKLLTQNIQTGFSWHPYNCQYFLLGITFYWKGLGLQLL